MRAPVTILLLLAAGVAAQPLPVAPDLKTAGWKEITVPGRRKNVFMLEADATVAIQSKRSVSFLYAPVSPATAARLAWRWRVDRDIAVTDLAAKGKDDRPLAVHVWFPAPDARKSGGLGRLIMAGMMGVPEWGRAITYVWGGDAAPGTVIPNPYMDGREGALIVLRQAGAPTGEWLSESVDLVADYRRVFGADPPPPSFVALSSDTDDTKQEADVRISALRFEPPP